MIWALEEAIRRGERLTEYLDAVSSEGLRVLEAELGDEDVNAWIERARERGAELLWLHTNTDLAGQGFERFPGFVRLRAESPPGGEPLPPLKPEHYPKTQEGAYRGLWGHKLVAEDAKPPPGAVVLGLYERDDPVGLCTVFVVDRLIDGPGVLSHVPDPAAYARLLLAACAELGPGPIDLESWGDSPAVIGAYKELGFAVTEHVDGWQLRVK